MFSEELLETGDLASRSCRVESRGSCAFINFDEDARSFKESIGPTAERLEAHGMSKRGTPKRR
jgi:hypothetical protein